MLFTKTGQTVSKISAKLRNRISRAILESCLTKQERVEFLKQSRHRFTAIRESHIEEETVNDMVDDAATEVGVDMGETDPNQEPIVDTELIESIAVITVAKENQDVLAKKYAVVLQMKKELEEQMKDKYGKEANSATEEIAEDMTVSESSLIALAANRFKSAKSNKRR